MLQRVSMRSISDRAYETIRDAIMRGQLQPGERLSEESIAEQLGVSKTPVHDALGRLVAEGLVEMTPYVGASVVCLSASDVDEIFDLRDTLEQLAIQQAIEHVDEDLLLELDREVLLFSRPLPQQELPRCFDVDNRLHDAIAQMSGNGRLVRILDMLRNQSHAARYLSSRLPGRPDQSLDEHRAIIAALLAHDVRRATDTMQAHLDASRRAAMSIVMDPRQAGSGDG
jgi:DNA-binding GntR family transcriptional regulator